MQYKKQTPKPKNKTKQKHQQANNTTRHKNKEQHGRWTAAQFMDNWKMHEEMITLYHLRDWYGNVKTKAKNRQQSAIQQFCEPGSNKSTMRKPRLPPARSLEITECKPHGQHSHRFMDTIQKPARRCLVASGKTLKSETWCESGAKVKRQRN